METFGFNEHTHDLTNDELELVPLVINGFKKYTKDNPIKSKQVISSFNDFLINNPKYEIKKISDVRLRKLINYIRTNGMLPIIGSSNGYYVSYDPDVIQEQITSLQERANSILRCANGISKFLKK
jgi:hypothetical protein